MASKKRVAVIGAGICGLGAVKWLKEEGIEPVCFEKTEYLGGLWRYHDEDIEGLASVMKSTIINTSKEMSAASDLPPPAEYPNYMPHNLMYKYICMAAEKCEAGKHIRYCHEVIKVEPTDDYAATGRWTVTTKDHVANEVKSEDFDGVAVCTGHHVFPNLPVFPGQENFKGRVIHTRSLKHAQGFENQNVLIIGFGSSAADAATEISGVANQVYISSRSGAWVIPRIGYKGYPIDLVIVKRCFFWVAHTMPYNLINFFFEKWVNMNLSHTLYNLNPKHKILGQHPTVSDTLPIKILSGKVVLRGQIRQFTEHGVIFEGEQKETMLDSVIFATGYLIKFPFLSSDVLPIKDNRVSLYKYIFPPHLPHPTLAMLGLVTPRGPGFSVGELQCRYASKVLSGKVKLPPKDAVYTEIQAETEINRRLFPDSPRHTLETDFLKYQDDLARQIGAKPNLFKMAITDPKLFWAIATGPCLPYIYRLEGPNKWEGARDAILTYEKRVKAPLAVPRQATYERRKSGMRVGRVLPKALFIVPFLWLFFFPLMIVTFGAW